MDIIKKITKSTIGNIVLRRADDSVIAFFDPSGYGCTPHPTKADCVCLSKSPTEQDVEESIILCCSDITHIYDNAFSGNRNALIEAIEANFNKGGSTGGGGGLSYTAEDIANKATSITSNTTSNTKYLSAKAVYDWVTSLFSGYATQSWVNTQISNLVNGAGAALDTLNELAASLGNDANFATTVATSIATKQAKFIQITGQSVANTGWTLVSGLYEKSITISGQGVTSTSIVDVIPDNASADIVKTAEMQPSTTSSTNAVKIYAKNVPSGTITVTLNIWN